MVLLYGKNSGMKGRLKISEVFVQGQPKVQFQEIDAKIYINLKKCLGTEIYTFPLHFLSLKPALVAATEYRDQMPPNPCRPLHSHYGKETYTESYFCIFHHQHS